MQFGLGGKVLVFCAGRGDREGSLCEGQGGKGGEGGC